MRKSWALAVILGWSGYGQQGPPPGPQTPAEVEQELRRQLRGLSERYEVPITRAPEQPTGESISVYGLQHKVPKAAQKSFDRARRLSKSGDHARAAAELEQTVKIDPLSARAYNQLGTEYGWVGRLDEAKAAFERALELDPDFWRAPYNLGLVLLQLGDLSGATQNARRALQHASEDAQVHWLLGYVLCNEETTRAEGLEHVRYAARTIKEAKQFLEMQQAR